MASHPSSWLRGQRTGVGQQKSRGLVDGRGAGFRGSVVVVDGALVAAAGSDTDALDHVVVLHFILEVRSFVLGLDESALAQNHADIENGAGGRGAGVVIACALVLHRNGPGAIGAGQVEL